MSLLAWVAAVAVLLGVLILVHELGHFVFAKIFDVKVLRFSLGFGPRLLGFTRGDTEYRLSLVPLGGYVRLLGEDPGRADPPHRSPARARREAALAALHGRDRGAGVQPAAAALHLLRSLRRPADAAAAHDRHRAPRSAGRVRRPARPAIGSNRSTGAGSATGRSSSGSSRRRPARRCASRSGAAPTARSGT